MNTKRGEKPPIKTKSAGKPLQPNEALSNKSARPKGPPQVPKTDTDKDGARPKSTVKFVPPIPQKVTPEGKETPNTQKKVKTGTLQMPGLVPGSMPSVEKKAPEPVKESPPPDLEVLPPAKEELPSVQEEPPSVQEELPSVQEEPPSAQEEPPSVQEEPPSVQEELPSVQEELPSVQEELPSAKEEFRNGIQEYVQNIVSITSLRKWQIGVAGVSLLLALSLYVNWHLWATQSKTDQPPVQEPQPTLTASVNGVESLKSNDQASESESQETGMDPEEKAEEKPTGQKTEEKSAKKESKPVAEEPVKEETVSNRLTGTLSIIHRYPSFKSVKVSVNKRFRGWSPLQLELPPGKYDITFSRDGNRAFRRVVVEAGKVIEVKARNPK